ncbi:hypothetical protein VTJ49DRAFT_1085 [Mycothermus thermophilus]|uniref:C2H2-type domain-containing protein n=1 Tax=Humicola insolens TaxID=85995 RepID=A0ABR3VDQ5_HUMIN
MDRVIHPQPESPDTQAGWTPAIVSTQQQQSEPSTMGPGTGGLGKRFKCSVPGCGRHFTRKEHLTRHVKSHSTQFQYQCPICGRRYARSDVLKRHVEFHPKNTSRGDKLVACVSCRDRKLKCDQDTPSANTTTDTRWSRDVEVANPSVDTNPTERSLQPTIRTPDVDVVNSAWPTGSHDHPSWMGQWPLSSLPSLTSPSGLASVVDPSLPHQSAGTSPNQESSGVAIDQITMSAATGPPLQLDSPNSWHPIQEEGMPEVPSRGGTDHDEPVSATPATTARSGRANAVSNVSSMITDQPFNSAPTHTRPSATSISSWEFHVEGGLHGLLHHDPTALRELVHIFFSEIHPYWPILHAPTFEIGIASDTLLGAMVMLASWVVGRQEHLDLAPLIKDEVTNAVGPESMPSLHSLQALLLCVVYAVCCRSEDGLLARAVRLNAIMVSTCRCLDIFSGHNILPDRLEECAFTLWLAKEQLHRLAFSVLRIDTYLSILLDHPPTVRFQELCIPLPKSSALWMAASEEERRKLQWDEPAGREKALFCSLMRDTLLGPGTEIGMPGSLPYRLSVADYHLGLCAMQNGIWEAAREAHSSASDEIVTKLSPGDPIVTWRTLLGQWRTRMMKDCGLTEHAVANALSSTARMPDQVDSNAILDPWTLTLLHISNIKMHAPLTLLRVHGSLLHGVRGPNMAVAAAMAAVQKPHARIRRWMSSNCPRMAVWSASQIARLVIAANHHINSSTSTSNIASTQPLQSSSPTSQQTSPTLLSSSGLDTPHHHRTPADRRLLLNPLAIPGLLMSAIVTCSYASKTTGACPACAGGSQSSSTAVTGNTLNLGSLAFDLFTATDDDETLIRWKESGVGWPVWDMTGSEGSGDGERIYVCRCGLPALGRWFSRALERDQAAKGEFEAFFEGLS